MTETVSVRRPEVIDAPRLRSVGDAADWITDRLDEITVARLRAGAVRLRGLPFASPEDFAVLRDRLISIPSRYVEKATPRSDYGNGVFTATDFPARREIRLHNENSYAKEFPGVLVFGCLVAPEEGGATTVGDMTAVPRLLPADVVERFRKAGWRLVRNYWGHLGLPWQVAFDTDDPDHVRRYGAEHDLEVSWVAERLRTTQVRSAIIRHPVTDEECWFNHVAFWSRWSLDEEVRELLHRECGEDLPYETTYGDGGALDRPTVDALNAAYDEVRVIEPWRPGDLLLVDNLLMAHGRSRYRGAREVLVALGDPVDRDSCEI